MAVASEPLRTVFLNAYRSLQILVVLWGDVRFTSLKVKTVAGDGAEMERLAAQTFLSR